MQTFEWIVRYPNFMKKAVPIIGSPKLTTAGLLLWQAEMRAIEAAETCHCDRRKMMFAVQAMHRQLRAMMSQDVAANAGGSMQRAAASVKARTLVVIATGPYGEPHTRAPLCGGRQRRSAEADGQLRAHGHRLRKREDDRRSASFSCSVNRGAQ
jgi:hypothetical protein